jgi:threonine dehydrogenase-like Zn-dependent dehydrogenase
MNKNLTVEMGNCPHRAIIPHLVDLVASGVSDPARLLTQIEPIDDVVKVYRTFDTREPSWVKGRLPRSPEPIVLATHISAGRFGSRRRSSPSR